jgi:phosphoribosylanthranilate isomerase
MTWVKICGITNLEDALVAVEAGADAVGFVFYEKSPRRVDSAQVREIVSALPERLEKVGVFVRKPPSEMEALAEEIGLTAWQSHIDLKKATLQKLLQTGGFFVLPEKELTSARKMYVSLPAELLLDGNGYRGLGWPKGTATTMSALFIDSGNGVIPGGTGRTFDWRQLQPAIQPLSMNFKVVVAGGLTPENVGEAMEVLHPWGVDVSSGVEAKPGKKDPDKVRAFIKAVREADKANSRN